MSATIVLVIDTGTTNYSAAESRDLLVALGDSFISCMGLRNSKRAIRHVQRVPMEELPLVELEGPWDATCDAGVSTLKLGFGIKWGVFLDDPVERAACLRETICIARAAGASRVVGFANEDYGAAAYELAIAGSSFDDVIRSLSGAKRVKVTSKVGLSIEAISDRLGVLQDLLECGYFVIDVDREARHHR